MVWEVKIREHIKFETMSKVRTTALLFILSPIDQAILKCKKIFANIFPYSLILRALIFLLAVFNKNLRNLYIYLSQFISILICLFLSFFNIFSNYYQNICLHWIYLHLHSSTFASIFICPGLCVYLPILLSTPVYH